MKHPLFILILFLTSFLSTANATNAQTDNNKSLAENFFYFSPGYKQEKFHLKTENQKEKINKIRLPSFEQKGEYFLNDNWVIGEKILFGKGKAKKDHIDTTSSFSCQGSKKEINSSFSLKPDVNSLQTLFYLGYSARFASIYITPAFGFAYELLKLKREKLPIQETSCPDNANWQTSPLGKLSSEYYMPFGRIALTIKPGVDCNWTFSPIYTLLYGRAKHITGYRDGYQTSPWRIKEKYFRAKALSHLLDFSLEYRKNRLATGVEFSWEIVKSYHAKRSSSFEDSTWQSFRGFLLLGYYF